MFISTNVMNKAILQNKETINFLLVMALFINAFAPFSVVLNQFRHNDDSSIEALFGDKILICTPFGYKYISIDELDEMDIDKNNTPNANSHCSLCLITTDDEKTFLFEFKTLIEIEILHARSTFIRIRTVLKSITAYSIAIPRAPPFSF